MTNLKNSGSLVAIPWAFVLLVAFVGLLFVPSCEAKQDRPDLGARIIKWIIRKAVQAVPQRSDGGMPEAAGPHGLILSRSPKQLTQAPTWAVVLREF